jgi:hypothetical protein
VRESGGVIPRMVFLGRADFEFSVPSFARKQKGNGAPRSAPGSRDLSFSVHCK